MTDKELEVFKFLIKRIEQLNLEVFKMINHKESVLTSEDCVDLCKRIGEIKKEILDI